MFTPINLKQRQNLHHIVVKEQHIVVPLSFHVAHIRKLLSTREGTCILVVSFVVCPYCFYLAALSLFVPA